MTTLNPAALSPSTAPSAARVWLMAVRPATLTAALAPVFVGTALAAASSTWSGLTFGVSLLGALLLQVGTNFANDLYDFKKGADTDDRLGPTRVTQQGLVSPRQMAIATAVTFAAAVGVGVYLIGVGGWPVLAIGVASILCGLAYTGGPYPLGYHGLGDVAVLIFFGPVAVCGTWWVHTVRWSNLAFIISLPIGLLIAAILIVNNVRDRHTDVLVGKRTLAVRFGHRASLLQYAAQVVIAYLIPVVLVVVGAAPLPWLLPLLSAPLALKTTRKVWTLDGADLNPCLGETAKLGLIFSLLLVIGVLL